jgi:transposase
VVAIPTLTEEDAKRPSRERQSLVGEQSRIVNRMKAALTRLGIRGFNPKLKRAAGRLDTLRTPEGEPIPPNTLAERRYAFWRQPSSCARFIETISASYRRAADSTKRV